MGHSFLRKIAQFVLTHPNEKVEVNVTQIFTGGGLNGQRILVTGGSRGLGYAMAKRFISEGAEVVITSRTEETLKQAAEELKCQYLVHDSGNIYEVNKVLEKTRELLHGEITSLVCNAGISLHEDGILGVSEEQFDMQFDTNVKGPYFLAKAYIESLNLDQYKQRNILFISSETADQAIDRPYGLTKASINKLAQGLAHRYGKSGLRANVIAPGVTITDMTSSYANVSNGNLAAANIPGRYYLPEEIAEVACFLLSDASLCINGEIIHCNGCNHMT